MNNINTFKTFLNKTLNDTLKKINKKMKEDGILYLWESQENFYNPDDMDIVHYENGESYVEGNYTDEMNLVNLKSILPEGLDEEVDIETSNFTTSTKLQDFIDRGFDKLKKKQRLDYIKERKRIMRNTIMELENDIHMTEQKLEDARNELEDFKSEENDLNEENN